MYKSKLVIILALICAESLFALEKVNLIKAHDFERNIGAWQIETGATGGATSKAVVVLQDSSIVYEKRYSAWFDNSKPPEGVYLDCRDTAVIYQDLTVKKKLSDLDSLVFFYYDSCNVDSVHHAYFSFDLISPIAPDRSLVMRYHLYNASPYDTPSEGGDRRIFPIKTTLNQWTQISRDVYYDFVTEKKVSPDYEVEGVTLRCFGQQFYDTWWGQKVYWDDIRLTGYADYDVGVKEILSGDSVWAGVYYKPVVRIKSFGREAADDFLAIAEIRQGEDLVWADTVPYTLPADTEDTLEFGSFPIPDAASYTLTVRTVMEPDESDEDDELSKPLHGTGIAEQPESQVVTLEVQSFSSNPRISYSLPQGQSGTISIYDASGRKVESLKVQGSGEVGLPFALSSGIYFVRLEAGSSAITRKAVIFTPNVCSAAVRGPQ